MRYSAKTAAPPFTTSYTTAAGASISLTTSPGHCWQTFRGFGFRQVDFVSRRVRGAQHWFGRGVEGGGLHRHWLLLLLALHRLLCLPSLLLLASQPLIFFSSLFIFSSASLLSFSW